jgi:hypothetical protein
MSDMKRVEKILKRVRKANAQLYQINALELGDMSCEMEASLLAARKMLRVLNNELVDERLYLKGKYPGADL